jgi:hypothetical protein
MPEQDSNTAEQADKALFLHLVMMLSASAMQQLGGVPNPETGEKEVSIEGAQVSIDMLGMLKNKTAGNLDKEEQALLEDTLASVQMQFFSASQGRAEAAPAEDEAAPAPEAPPAEAQGPAVAGESEPPRETHEPKYHKSYG